MGGGTEAGITAARCEQLERDTCSLLGVAGGATASGSKLLAPFWPLGPRDQERDWLGFRPTLPDALPVIGRSSKSPHVLYAFGHQHVGWTLGALRACWWRSWPAAKSPARTCGRSGRDASAGSAGATTNWAALGARRWAGSPRPVPLPPR